MPDLTTLVTPDVTAENKQPTLEEIENNLKDVIKSTGNLTSDETPLPQQQLETSSKEAITDIQPSTDSKETELPKNSKGDVSAINQESTDEATTIKIVGENKEKTSTTALEEAPATAAKPQEPVKSDAEIFKEQLVKRLKTSFSVFDGTGNGTCDVREIGTIIRSISLNPSEAELQQMIKLMEDPAKGPCGFVQFHRFSEVLFNVIVKNEPFSLVRDDEEKVFQAFRTLDTENLGYVLPDKMKEYLTTMGETFTADEVEEFLLACTDPVEKKIFYSDYVHFLCV